MRGLQPESFVLRVDPEYVESSGQMVYILLAVITSELTEVQAGVGWGGVQVSYQACLRILEGSGCPIFDTAVEVSTLCIIVKDKKREAY